MRRALLASLLLLPVLLAQEPPPPGEPPPAPVREFLDAWADATRELRTLRVEFTQTKRLKLLRRPLISHGTTLLVGPRVRMDVRGEDGALELILLVIPAAPGAPGEVRLYHPRLARQEIYPLAEGAPPPESPFLVFGDDVRELPRRYEVALEAGAEGRETLVLTPRSSASQVASMRLEFRERRLVAVEQRDRRGGAVRMEITRWEPNPTLDEAALNLELPSGTEVVRPQGR